MNNALTIDVEDYYMVSAFADVVKFEDWHGHESRVEKNTCRILDLLAEYNTSATFFILGWLAERHPSLVRNIQSAGHEIACHGYNHRLVYDLTPEEFRQDTKLAKSILEDLTGAEVLGYRAASYSITGKSQWALDILIEEGFQYDSSIFPIHHDRYGVPGAARFIHTLQRESGTIMEMPPSTFQIFGQNIPIAGGGYLRLFPSKLTKAAIHSINEMENKPVVVYMHPWEIDVDQPRLNGNWKAKFRHYLNLESTLPKMKDILEEFKFKPAVSLLAGYM